MTERMGLEFLNKSALLAELIRLKEAYEECSFAARQIDGAPESPEAYYFCDDVVDMLERVENEARRRGLIN